MKAIESRLYTNVILTVIAVGLLALAFGPMFSVSASAYAEPQAGAARYRTATTDQDQVVRRSEDKIAAATQAVAASTQDIAAAIREAAKSQKEIAQALEKLAKSGN